MWHTVAAWRCRFASLRRWCWSRRSPSLCVGGRGDCRVSRLCQDGHPADAWRSSRRQSLCRSSLRSRKPRTGSIRIGRPRIRRTGSITPAAAPRPSRCITAWFVALEQAGLHLISWPGLLDGPPLSRTIRLHTQPEDPFARRCGKPCVAIGFREHPGAEVTEPAFRRHICRPAVDPGRDTSTACRSASRACPTS